MSLIDASYFVGELNIPNTTTPAIAERLRVFIDKYERRFLEDLLGYELWKLLDTQITQEDENSPATPLPRLASLLDGVEYTDNGGVVRKWRGLVYIDGELPSSLIANFIYWHWMRDQATQSTGLGEAATQAQNATLVSPTGKMVAAWNEMANGVAHLYYFLNSNQVDYPEWVASNKWAMYKLAANVNQFGI